MLFMNAAGQIDAEPPRLSFLDHGFLFGDSIYEVVRSYDKKLFGWVEHRERLIQSAQRIGIPIESRIGLIESRMHELFTAFKKPHAALRMVITRGEGKMHIDYRSCKEPQIFMAIWEIKESEIPSSVRLMIPKIRRNPREALDPAIKSGNYLNSVLALREAVDSGFDDALMLNPQGEITELTTSNIGWFRGGAIETPHTDVGILHGVTRRHLLRFQKVKEVRSKESVIDECEEMFVISTLKEVLPVSEVQLSDGRVKKFNSMRLTQSLREEFRHQIREHLKSEKEFYS
jgi:branched-chain amino acid aminotransferase